MDNSGALSIYIFMYPVIPGREERYPDLKADAVFRQLGNRITEIEDQIADRRELYNASVTTYNTRLEQFPDVFVARALNFDRRTLWQIDPEHRRDVEVSFEHSLK